MTAEAHGEWKLRPLLECVRTIGGGTPSRSVPQYFEGSIPWLTVADMPPDSGVLKTIKLARQAITKDALENSAARIIPPGAVLFTTRVALGKVAIAGGELATNQDFTSFVPVGELDPRFLGYYLLSVRSRLESIAQGATVRGLPRRILESLTIPIPTLDEQRRVVALIEDLLNRLEQATRLRQEATSNVDSLFAGALRHEFTRMKDVGVPLLAVKEIAEVKLGRQRSPANRSKNYPRKYVRVANVFRGYFDLSDVKDMEFLPGEFERYKLEDGDILLCEGQSAELVGRCAIWRGQIPDCCFQNTLIRVRCDRFRMIPEFCSYALTYAADCGDLSRISKQSTNIAHLGAQRLAEYAIPVPSLDEQRRMVDRSNQVQAGANELRRLQAATKNTIVVLTSSILDQVFSGHL